MATKATAKKVTKKRVKKNVERGQAHIQSSFNNTMLFHGQVPADLDSEDQESLHHTQLRWLLRQLQRLHSFMVLSL